MGPRGNQIVLALVASVKAIADNADARWTFLLFHKPVYQREDDSGLKRIEKALTGRPYTVLNGHLHRHSHASRQGRDYVMLARLAANGAAL